MRAAICSDALMIALMAMGVGPGDAVFVPTDLASVLARLQALPQITDITLMTHFASADEITNPFTEHQTKLFFDTTAHEQLPKSLANSAAILTRSHRVELDVTGARTEVAELVGVEQPDLVLVNDDDGRHYWLGVMLDVTALVSVIESDAVDDTGVEAASMAISARAYIGTGGRGV